MGGRSSSSSSQASNQSSFSQGLYGDNNGLNIAGNGNTVTYTDYGAINEAMDVVNNSLAFADSAVATTTNAMGEVASDGLALADSLGNNAMQLGYELGNNGINAGTALANQSFEFASSAIDTNASLVDSYGETSALMLDRALASNEGVLSDTAALLDNQSARNINAAMAVTELGQQQLQIGSELALALSSQTTEAAIEAQKDNNAALTNGFKSMMQFADSFSRSDGASIAESNNKMIMMLAGGLVISIFIFKKLG